MIFGFSFLNVCFCLSNKLSLLALFQAQLALIIGYLSSVVVVVVVVVVVFVIMFYVSFLCF